MKTTHFLIALSGLILISCNSNKDRNNSDSSGAASGEDQLQQTDVPSGIEKEPQFSENSFLIDEHAAGEFELGEPIPTFLEGHSITKVQQTRTTEGGPADETVYIVAKDSSEILSILPAIDSNTGRTTGDIGELRISSGRYKTAEGIGVGSTLEEFIEQYPNSKIWYTYVGNMYVVEAEEIEAQFLLEEEAFMGEMEINSVMTPLKKEDFKEAAKIVMIRMIP